MPTVKIFVSYQRADTALAAHALGYALRLGGHDAFVDTGSIGVGELYRQVIANAVSTSHLMFALIGPAFDARRLARAHQRRVLRVAARPLSWRRRGAGASWTAPAMPTAMPTDEQLPPALRWLTRRNALALRLGSVQPPTSTPASRR